MAFNHPLVLPILVILVVVLAALGLAKHGKGRGRKFRPYLKGALDESLALSTLGSKVLIGANAEGVLEEKAWLTSIKATWALSEFTPATDDGPIYVGVAHNSYSDGEIEAWLENETGSWAAGSLVQQEVAKRKIRQVGVFRVSGTDATNVYVLNEGRPIHTKCGWQLQTGDTVKVWAYNAGASALATTSPNLIVLGHANLWPN